MAEKPLEVKQPRVIKPKEFGLKDKLTFGKYKGKTLEFVVKKDPEYIEWAKKNCESYILKTKDNK